MKKIKILILLFVLAFVLNFAWETLQAPLYSGNTIGIRSFWLLMLYASFIDAAWILAVYGLISIIDKTVEWKLNVVNVVLFSILLFAIAFFVEKYALSVGRWSYSSLMPVIFGIGLSPLVQLAVTGITSLFLSRKIIK